MADIWEKQLYQTTNHKLMVGVCEENNEKMTACQLKYFAVKGLALEACRRTVTTDRDDFHYTDFS